MRATLLVLIAAIAAGCGNAHVVEHPPPGQLDAIVWLQGAWRAREGDRVTDEVWTPTGERTWMGLGRTTEAGQTVHHEVLRMEVHEDGVRYVAAPAGQSRTAFALVRSDETEARFENPGHDFPTWIRYQRAGRALTASIGDADRGEDAPAATWAFQRRGDAPALLDVPARVCRDGGTLRVEVPPCQCGGQLFCAGFETEGGLDVHVALLDASCDACTSTEGSCELSGGDVVRVNGHPVERDAEGCVVGPVPLLVLVDL